MNIKTTEQTLMQAKLSITNSNKTQAPLSNSEPEPERGARAKKLADRLWDRFVEIYGAAWIRENGADPSAPWVELCACTPPETLKKALDELTHRIEHKSQWAVSYAQFKGIVFRAEHGDRMKSGFLRVMRSKFADDLERYILNSAGYEMRRSDWGKAQDLFNDCYVVALELQRAGKLPSGEILQLEQRSRVTERDKHITDRASTKDAYGHIFGERIKKIMKMKKDNAMRFFDEK